MWNLKPYQGTFGICYMKSHVSRYLTHPQFRGMMPRGSWKILLHWVIQTFWNVDLFSYMTSKKKITLNLYHHCSQQKITEVLGLSHAPGGGNPWSEIPCLLKAWVLALASILSAVFPEVTGLLHSFSGQCAPDTPICMTFVCQPWVKTILREQKRLFQLHTQSRGAFLWDNCCTAVCSRSAF